MPLSHDRRWVRYNRFAIEIIGPDRDENEASAVAAADGYFGDAEYHLTGIASTQIGYAPAQYLAKFEFAEIAVVPADSPAGPE